MNIRHAVSFALACALVGVSRPSPAQTPTCDGLAADKKSLMQSLFATVHPYDGCDDTFARCLAARPPSSVVLRLAEDLCRQAKAGKDRKQIEFSFGKRAQSMLPGGPRLVAKIDEATRAHYAALYARPHAMHDALEQFADFLRPQRGWACWLHSY